MLLGVLDRCGDKLLAWTLTLVLVLALVGLGAATSESLRRQEHRGPFPDVLEPEPPRPVPETPDVYHAPGVAGWPAP